MASEAPEAPEAAAVASEAPFTNDTAGTFSVRRLVGAPKGALHGGAVWPLTTAPLRLRVRFPFVAPTAVSLVNGASGATACHLRCLGCHTVRGVMSCRCCDACG